MNWSDHLAFRRRAGDGAIFTSSKCPNGPGLNHSCELPFGFVWTPMSPSPHCAVISLEQETLPPIICLNCLSYLNLYCNYDGNTGHWTCAVCGAQNVSTPDVFTVGAGVSATMACPLIEYRQLLPNHNQDGSPDSTTCVVVLDANLSPADAHRIASTLRGTLSKEVSAGKVVRLGLVTFDETVSMYQVGLRGMVSADVRVLPMEDQEARSAVEVQERQYLVELRQESDLQQSLMLCVSAAFGLPKDETSTETTTLSRKEMLRRKKEARLKKQRGLKNGRSHSTVVADSPWMTQQQSSIRHRCTGEAIHCAMEIATFGMASTSRTSRILLFTNGCPNMGEANVVKTRDRHTNAPDVVDPMSLRTAMSYFDLAAKTAFDNGIGFDVFCTGAGSLGLTAYQALVEPSAGYALPHDSFTTLQFEKNLNYVFSQTHLSISSRNPLDSTQSSVGHIDDCVIDIRLPRFITATHVVGATHVIQGDDEEKLLPSEGGAFAEGASLAARQGIATNNLPSEDVVDATLTRVCLGRFDPLSTLSVMLQVNDEIQEDEKHALCQLVARFVEPDGRTLVTRIFSQRLPVARNVHDFLDGMDEEVVPIVLGKEAVSRAVIGRQVDDSINVMVPDLDQMELLAYEAQKDLDNTIHRISGAFRLTRLEEGSGNRDLIEEGGVSAAHSSLDFAFPPELADALHRLYHLRRGAMLSPGLLRSLDERAEIRDLYLRLPLDDCLCMMAPSLWSVNTSGSASDLTLPLDPIPSDTLTLWDTRIIAADHHDGLFVWSGKATTDSTLDAIRNHCRDFLLERSKTRFPMPQLHLLREGDSMSRRFTTRLAPSHADPADQQVVHFPALATMSPTQLSELRAKFRFHDSKVDASFRHWFWSVTSASSNARNEGMSLCE